MAVQKRWKKLLLFLRMVLRLGLSMTLVELRVVLKDDINIFLSSKIWWF